MNANEMRAVLELCKVPEFEFRVHEEQLFRELPYRSEEPREVRKLYLQGHYMEVDVRSQVLEPQSTRKWPLSEHMVKNELINTAFKCYMTSMEHQARESFTYRGRRIFGPHFDPDVLWEIAGKDANLDYRRTEPAVTNKT